MKNIFELNCVKNAKCLACDGEDLRIILDFGNQPLANNYHKGEKLEEFPLKVNLCLDCYHLQLSHVVNPNLMFKNYLYVSGTTNTLKKYFDWFANLSLQYFPEAKSVLDIACNDGTQLDSFKKIGFKTYGIDPAVNLFNESTRKGHQIICDYFNSTTISNFEDLKFDIITAQNVFAHTYYTLDFLSSCKKLMHDKSILFIQTSQANMVVNNELTPFIMNIYLFLILIL